MRFESVLADPSLIEGELFGSSIGSLKPKKSVLLLPFEVIVDVLQVSLLLKYNKPSMVSILQIEACNCCGCKSREASCVVLLGGNKVV